MFRVSWIVVLLGIFMVGCADSLPPTAPPEGARDRDEAPGPNGFWDFFVPRESGPKVESPEARGMTVAFNDGFLLREDVEAQDFLNLLGVSEAHQISRGAGITIALIDTGVDPTHPDLASRIRAGHDYVDDDDTPWETRNESDDDGDGIVDEGYGHGTHLAGLMALLAPEAEILVYRVLDDEGRGDASWVGSAIRKAVEDGASVISLSLGIHQPILDVQRSVIYATLRNVMVVASVGNEGGSQIQFPAAYLGSVGVGSTTVQDVLAPFSNFGLSLYISAPGEAIVSTYPGGGYATWSGTSMSTAMVAALAGLYYAQDDDISWLEITYRLAEGSVQIEGPDYSGVGRISFLSLLDL